MKKTNKGFTIVELIIVIAVIGVLAAILIPTFAGVIEKANAKSALSDARNALSTYLANTSTDEAGATIENDTVFVVEKAGKFHSFTYQGGKLYTKAGTQPEDADPAYPSPAVQATGAAITNVPSHVDIYTGCVIAYNS